MKIEKAQKLKALFDSYARYTHCGNRLYKSEELV